MAALLTLQAPATLALQLLQLSTYPLPAAVLPLVHPEPMQTHRAHTVPFVMRLASNVLPLETPTVLAAASQDFISNHHLIQVAVRLHVLQHITTETHQQTHAKIAIHTVKLVLDRIERSVSNVK